MSRTTPLLSDGARRLEPISPVRSLHAKSKPLLKPSQPQVSSGLRVKLGQPTTTLLVESSAINASQSTAPVSPERFAESPPASELPTPMTTCRASLSPQISCGTAAPDALDDFDMCFVFVLPGYSRQLKNIMTPPKAHRALFEKLEKEAIDEEETANATFLKQLDERSKRKGIKAKTVHGQAKELFLDFFDSQPVADKFECGTIENLEDARKVCIDLLLDFFRKDENAYYTYLFTSIDNDELLLCVKMLEHTAEAHAEDSTYPLQLDMAAVRNPDLLNVRLEEGTGIALTPAYIKFMKSFKHLFAKKPVEANPSKTSVLRKVDNICLLYDRITDVLDIEAMLKWGLLKHYFPLHSKPPLKKFREKWAIVGKWYRCDQPIHDISDYFGENVALYFVFTQHLCQYTAALAAFSFLMMMANFATKPPQFGSKVEFLASFGGVTGNPHVQSFSVLFMVLWINAFLLHLRRKVRYYMICWGSDSGIETTVKPRLNPRFAAYAHLMPSEVDHNLTEYGVAPKMRKRGRVLSLIGSCIFIAILCCGVSSFFKIQANLTASGKITLATYVSYGTTIQIKVMNFLWGIVCVELTDREFHRDQLDYDLSCALKTFYIQFINMYCSFYYIAFFMQLLGDTSYEKYGSTWQYLTYQMFTTFFVYLAFSAYDLASPLITLWRSQKEELAKLKSFGKLPADATKLEYSYVELQAKMEVYTGDAENADYMDLIAIFGFVLLFGLTNPLCSALAFVYLGLQMRVDAWKLTHIMQRPYPRRAPEEWVWNRLIHQLALAGFGTNLGLFCFCSGSIGGGFLRKAVAFWGLLFCTTVFQLMMMWLYPETSDEMQLAKLRHKRQRAAAHAYKDQVQSGEEVLVLRGRTNIDFSNIEPLTPRRHKGVFSVPLGDDHVEHKPRRRKHSKGRRESV